MMLGLAMSWLAVVALLLGGGWLAGQDLVREVNFSHLRYEAQLIADEVAEEIEVRLAALERLSNDEAIQQGSAGVTHDDLRVHQPLLELFDGLVAFGPEGRVLADWPITTGREGLDISDREYFAFVREVRRPYVSEPIVGRATGTPLVLLVVPVLNEKGDFQGALAGVVNVNSGGIFRGLSRIRLGDEGFAAVFTSSRQVLYHPERKWVMRKIQDLSFNPDLDRAADGWEGERYGALVDGRMAYQAFRQVWPADWVVGVFLPEGQVLAPLKSLVQRLGWMGVALALMLLPLLAWLVWLMLRPLYQLQSQIAEVGKGKRRRVVLDTEMRELTQVASVFNEVDLERSKALLASRERQAFLDAVLSSSPLGMFVTNTQGDIVFVNAALSELTGRGSEARQERSWINHVHADDRQAAMELWRYSLVSGQDFLRQYRYWRGDGELLWLEVHASQVASDGEVIGFVGTVKDITARLQEEAIRQWEAEHDPLTGLLNRRGFERRLNEALAEWRKTHTASALILFDLDRFKPINDRGGHLLGDEMLRQIATRVAGAVRNSDHVARPGGDEFAVLLPSCSLSQARAIAEKLLAVVHDASVERDGEIYRVTPSLGLTEFREGDSDIAHLIERADAASYLAKQKGRNCLVVDEDDTHDPQ